MNESEINARLSATVKAMMAKGVKTPRADIWFQADSQPMAYLAYGGLPDSPDKAGSECLHADSAKAVFAKVDEWIEKQPDPETAKMRQFMKAVATAIDIGKANGIDLELVNPLAETMKRLSENALMYEAPAAEDEIVF